MDGSKSLNTELTHTIVNAKFRKSLSDICSTVVQHMRKCLILQQLYHYTILLAIANLTILLVIANGPSPPEAVKPIPGNGRLAFITIDILKADWI